MKNFEKIADEALYRIFSLLDEDERFESTLEEGVLSVKAAKGEYVINRHSASGKIWYSSPAGLKYFIFIPEKGEFVEQKTGETLLGVCCSVFDIEKPKGCL